MASSRNKKEDFIAASNKLLNEASNMSNKAPTDDQVDNEVLLSQYELTLFQRLFKPLVPFTGIFLGVMSAFSFCLSQVQLRRSKWFSATDHSIIRYCTALTVMLVFLKYKEMSVFGPKKQIKLLLTRGFIGNLRTFWLSRFY